MQVYLNFEVLLFETSKNGILLVYFWMVFSLHFKKMWLKEHNYSCNILLKTPYGTTVISVKEMFKSFSKQLCYIVPSVVLLAMLRC